MNTLYTDLQKLVQEHCDAVVCVNGSMLAKDLRELLKRHQHEAALQELADQVQELKLGY